MENARVENSQSQKATGGIQKRELFLHCLMQWLSMQQELSEFRAQFHSSNDHFKVKYLSGALGHIQIFFEFMFDVSNKDVKPLVLLLEGVKALLKLKEYQRLVCVENIKVNVDFETYKNLKETEIYEKSLIKMVRSKKQLARPTNTVISTELETLRDKQKVNPKKSEGDLPNQIEKIEGTNPVSRILNSVIKFFLSFKS